MLFIIDKQDNEAAGATVPVYAEVHKPSRNIGMQQISLLFLKC